MPSNYFESWVSRLCHRASLPITCRLMANAALKALCASRSISERGRGGELAPLMVGSYNSKLLVCKLNEFLIENSLSFLQCDIYFMRKRRKRSKQFLFSHLIIISDSREVKCFAIKWQNFNAPNQQTRSWEIWELGEQCAFENRLAIIKLSAKKNAFFRVEPNC